MTLACFEGDNNKALVKTSKNRDDVTQRTMGVSSQFASSSFQKQKVKLDVTSGAGLRHHLKRRTNEHVGDLLVPSQCFNVTALLS